MINLMQPYLNQRTMVLRNKIGDEDWATDRFGANDRNDWVGGVLEAENTKNEQKNYMMKGSYNQAINTGEARDINKNAHITKTFDLDGVDTGVYFRFNMYEFDSWDNEDFYMSINNEYIHLGRFARHYEKEGYFDSKDDGVYWVRDDSPEEHINQQTIWKDQKHYYEVYITPDYLKENTNGEELTIGFASKLGGQRTNLQGAIDNDESWGIDNFAIAYTDNLVSQYNEFFIDPGDLKSKISNATIFKTVTANKEIQLVKNDIQDYLNNFDEKLSDLNDEMNQKSYDHVSEYNFIDISAKTREMLEQFDDTATQMSKAFWKSTTLDNDIKTADIVGILSSVMNVVGAVAGMTPRGLAQDYIKGKHPFKKIMEQREMGENVLVDGFVTKNILEREMLMSDLFAEMLKDMNSRIKELNEIGASNSGLISEYEELDKQVAESEKIAKSLVANIQLAAAIEEWEDHSQSGIPAGISEYEKMDSGIHMNEYGDIRALGFDLEAGNKTHNNEDHDLTSRIIKISDGNDGEDDSYLLGVESLQYRYAIQDYGSAHPTRWYLKDLEIELA
jgi:hypothetical protein